MVKIPALLRTVIAISILLFTSCNPEGKPNVEGNDIGLVEGTLNRLSPDVANLLATGTITNIQSLRVEYSRRFPGRPALFYAAPLKPVYPRDSEYQLPARDYYWLKEWSNSDALTTPLFWSYFHTPNAVVSYLTIDGREMWSSSNDFYHLVVQLSNRIERAQTQTRAITNASEPQFK